jgi:hypothetical protein
MSGGEEADEDSGSVSDAAEFPEPRQQAAATQIMTTTPSAPCDKG